MTEPISGTLRRCNDPRRPPRYDVTRLTYNPLPSPRSPYTSKSPTTRGLRLYRPPLTREFSRDTTSTNPESPTHPESCLGKRPYYSDTSEVCRGHDHSLRYSRFFERTPILTSPGITLILVDPYRINRKGMLSLKEDRNLVRVGPTDKAKGEKDTESTRDSERTT